MRLDDEPVHVLEAHEELEHEVRDEDAVDDAVQREEGDLVRVLEGHGAAERDLDGRHDGREEQGREGHAVPALDEAAVGVDDPAVALPQPLPHGVDLVHQRLLRGVVVHRVLGGFEEALARVAFHDVAAAHGGAPGHLVHHGLPRRPAVLVLGPDGDAHAAQVPNGHAPRGTARVPVGRRRRHGRHGARAAKDASGPLDPTSRPGETPRFDPSSTASPLHDRGRYAMVY